MAQQYEIRLAGLGGQGLILAGIIVAEAAGMKLLRRPRSFTVHTSRQLMRLMGRSDEAWRKYLFF